MHKAWSIWIGRFVRACEARDESSAIRALAMLEQIAAEYPDRAAHFGVARQTKGRVFGVGGVTL